MKDHLADCRVDFFDDTGEWRGQYQRLRHGRTEGLELRATRESWAALETGG